MKHISVTKFIYIFGILMVLERVAMAIPVSYSKYSVEKTEWVFIGDIHFPEIPRDTYTSPLISSTVRLAEAGKKILFLNEMVLDHDSGDDKIDWQFIGSLDRNLSAKDKYVNISYKRADNRSSEILLFQKMFEYLRSGLAASDEKRPSLIVFRQELDKHKKSRVTQLSFKSVLERTSLTESLELNSRLSFLSKLLNSNSSLQPIIRRYSEAIKASTDTLMQSFHEFAEKLPAECTFAGAIRHLGKFYYPSDDLDLDELVKLILEQDIQLRQLRQAADVFMESHAKTIRLLFEAGVFVQAAEATASGTHDVVLMTVGRAHEMNIGNELVLSGFKKGPHIEERNPGSIRQLLERVPVILLSNEFFSDLAGAFESLLPELYPLVLTHEEISNIFTDNSN